MAHISNLVIAFLFVGLVHKTVAQTTEASKADRSAKLLEELEQFKGDRENIEKTISNIVKQGEQNDKDELEIYLNVLEYLNTNVSKGGFDDLIKQAEFAIAISGAVKKAEDGNATSFEKFEEIIAVLEEFMDEDEDKEYTKHAKATEVPYAETTKEMA